MKKILINQATKPLKKLSKFDFFEHLWYNVYTFEMGVFQMNSFIVTQSRIKENELLKSVEEFSKKLYSTFDLIFDELRIHSKNAEFTPNKKGLDCGTIKIQLYQKVNSL